MNIAGWLRLVSPALYMTDPGRTAFDLTLVSEAATGVRPARPSVRQRHDLNTGVRI